MMSSQIENAQHPLWLPVPDKKVLFFDPCLKMLDILLLFTEQRDLNFKTLCKIPVLMAYSKTIGTEQRCFCAPFPKFDVVT